MNNTISIPTSVKLSKNYEINEFLNSFLYDNPRYFQSLVEQGHTSYPSYFTKADTGGFFPGIHYETGKWKWGSVGLMNRMIKRGLVTIAKDHRNDCYCLDATIKLINMILKGILKTK